MAHIYSGQIETLNIQILAKISFDDSYGITLRSCSIEMEISRTHKHLQGVQTSFLDGAVRRLPQSVCRAAGHRQFHSSRIVRGVQL